MPYILLILAAFCCSIAAFWGPGRSGPWYGYIHFGWAGVALYLWSLVLVAHR